MKLMSLKEELQQANELAYNTWFYRWLKKYALEDKLHDAAMEGYEAITIFNLRNYSQDSDKGKYLIKRFMDNRFVEKLKKAYPSLKFEVIDEEQTKKNILGMTYKHRVYEVIVYWD